jgi:hypothetical protein
MEEKNVLNNLQLIRISIKFNLFDCRILRTLIYYRILDLTLWFCIVILMFYFSFPCRHSFLSLSLSLSSFLSFLSLFLLLHGRRIIDWHCSAVTWGLVGYRVEPVTVPCDRIKRLAQATGRELKRDVWSNKMVLLDYLMTKPAVLGRLTPVLLLLQSVFILTCCRYVCLVQVDYWTREQEGTMIKRISRSECEGVDWINLAHDAVHWWALVNTVVSILVP